MCYHALNDSQTISCFFLKRNIVKSVFATLLNEYRMGEKVAARKREKKKKKKKVCLSRLSNIFFFNEREE